MINLKGDIFSILFENIYVLQKLADGNLQPLGNAINTLKCGIFLPTLQLSDIGGVEIAHLCQTFLAHSFFFSVKSNPLSDFGRNRIVVFGIVELIFFLCAMAEEGGRLLEEDRRERTEAKEDREYMEQSYWWMAVVLFCVGAVIFLM